MQRLLKALFDLLQKAEPARRRMDKGQARAVRIRDGSSNDVKGIVIGLLLGSFVF